MSDFDLSIGFTLCLFDGASGGAQGGESAADMTGADNPSPDAGEANKGRKANPLATVKYGVQEEQPAVDAPTEPEPDIQVKAENAPNRSDEFEKLIKGEYKEEFAKRTQTIIDRRLKEAREFKTQLEAHRPVLELLSRKYGIEAKDGDYSALLKAIEEDDSYYEQEAFEKGVSVEQLKAVKKMERENAELRRTVEERERQERAHLVYQKWLEQGEQLKAVYPAFDFDAELQNQQFVDLIKRDVDVRTAYEVVHKDEIIGGAMQYAANKAAAKVTDSIASRAARPQENGTAAQPGIITKTDVNALTRKDREEIERRVARGEKIRF